MGFKYKWPPYLPEIGGIVKKYIDENMPLSIPDGSGIYAKLEKKFAALHNRKYCLSVSSGTMALYSAFFSIGIKPGDEVICTVYSYHATAAPLLHLGAKIVFCDVEKDTGNIDADLIETLINDKTKVIVTNDQWGHPCEKEKICYICKKHNLIYVEDCSHAHFSEYKNQRVGTFGDIACWSLQGNKLLSGGEGGILATDNQDYFEKAVLLGHNLKRPGKCVKNIEYDLLLRTGYGLKLRMHPLAALIVYYELENYCFTWIQGRKNTLGYFNSIIGNRTFFQPMTIKNYVSSMGAWYGFCAKIKSEYIVDRKHFIAFMAERNFEAAIPNSGILADYALFNDERVIFANFAKLIPKKHYPNAEIYHNSIIRFPSYTFNEFELIDKIVSAVQEYTREYL